jgi:mRNA interferase MazF
VVRRGEIYLCDFGDPAGHEPGWRRPALVVSDNLLNQHGVPVVLPITKRRRGYPTHVELDGPLPLVSYVQCELIRAVAHERLIRQVGQADAAVMARVSLVLTRLLGL